MKAKKNEDDLVEPGSVEPGSAEFVENPVENSVEENVFAEKVAELTGDLQRTRADFENFRKQTEVQKNQAINLAKLATVSKVLPLLDDIERAIVSFPEQLSPLAKSLEKSLKELGLEKIDSEVETEFDPDLHDAVMVEESHGEKKVVAETLRTGYFYDGEVVRPAMVKVKRV